MSKLPLRLLLPRELSASELRYSWRTRAPNEQLPADVQSLLSSLDRMSRAVPSPAGGSTVIRRRRGKWDNVTIRSELTRGELKSMQRSSPFLFWEHAVPSPPDGRPRLKLDPRQFGNCPFAKAFGQSLELDGLGPPHRRSPTGWTFFEARVSPSSATPCCGSSSST